LKQTKNEILSLCDLLIEFCGSAKPFEELLCLKHLLKAWFCGMVSFFDTTVAQTCGRSK
jgi:hypothetical protein